MGLVEINNGNDYIFIYLKRVYECLIWLSWIKSLMLSFSSHCSFTFCIRKKILSKEKSLTKGGGVKKNQIEFHLLK